MKMNYEGKFENLLFLIKRFRHMSIRKKLVLFFCISLVAVLILFGSTTYISRKTILNTSRDSIINLSSQIMENLDNKVCGVENASYQVKKSLEERKLNDVSKDTSYFDYKVKSQQFQDAIIVVDDLYRNIDGAVFENVHGVMFHYQKNVTEIDEKYEALIEDLKGQLSTSRPYIWWEVDGRILFLRYMVNENTLKPEGCLFLILIKEFFHLIDMENQLLSNENMIIVDRRKKILRNDSFDSKTSEIQRLLEKPNMGESTSEMIHYHGQEYLVLLTDSQRTDWKTLILVPIGSLIQQQNEFIRMSFVVVCIMLLILIFISQLLNKAITTNIRILEEGMERFEEDGKALRLKPYNYDEVGKLIARFNYMTVRIQKLNEDVLIEREKKEKAEFQALQSKVNPHFLYNTLGSIKWISHRERQDYIEKMIDALIYLMRFSIEKTDTFITVEEELTYIQSYLKLQEMRFGKVYTVKFCVEEELKEKKILGFILQPIVENALYHGIDMEDTDGEIVISIKSDMGMISIRVCDNGKGMTKERIEEVMQEEKEYTGFNSIGIQIIASRLSTYYKNCHVFQIQSEPGKGTEVVIKIPWEGENYAEDINCG